MLAAWLSFERTQPASWVVDSRRQKSARRQKLKELGRYDCKGVCGSRLQMPVGPPVALGDRHVGNHLVDDFNKAHLDGLRGTHS